MTGPVDLGALLGGAGDGVHWTLADPSDLNANLVHLGPGGAVEEHVNREVDVLVVVVDGAGTVELDGDVHDVAPRSAIHLPKGSTRRIAAGPPGLWYLTVHRRRSGPQVSPRRSSPT